ncbi:MAG: glycosyltransferase [Clostridia bacterium]|nr:glycosyltransferase [Clostridia bacterium]
MTKIIHYCWFGGKPLNQLTLKCIESWKKHLPDFKIKEWNETNFDVNQCIFIKEAYEQKKWAFVADYTRFKVLEQYGGIYLDTDMEITADVSKYLENDLFFGKEDSKMINAAVVWSKYPQNKHIYNILQIYEESKVFNPTGDLFDQSVPKVLTKYFNEYGFQEDSEEIQLLNNDIYIYPMEYFYPLSYDHQNNKFTDKSCMIHHFDATWTSKGEQIKTKLKRNNFGIIVYLIDFFVMIKNKLMSMLNYRDISIFLTCVCIFSIYYFLSLPKIDIAANILQIILISFIWTFICESARTSELNKWLDEIKGNEKISLFDIRRNKVKENKYDFIFKSEKNIYLKQIIVTIIFALTPIVGILTGTLSISEILYSLCILLVTYMMYVGIINKFKYRILELVFIAFLLIAGQVYFTNSLIFTGVLILSLILLTLLNKINKKRFIVFLISLVLFSVTLFGIKLITNKERNTNEYTSNYKHLYSFKDIQTLDNLDIEHYNGKSESFISNEFKIKDSDNIAKKLSYTPTVILYITIAIIGIFSLIKRNGKYLLLSLPILLQFFNNVSLNILLYVCYINFYFAILILVSKTNIKKI